MKLIIWGVGGLAQMLTELIESYPEWHLVGFIVDDPAPPEQFMGYPVLGNRQYLESLDPQAVQVVPAAYLPANREIMVIYLRQLGFDSPTLIAKSAWLSPSVSLGKGVMVLDRAVIQSQAQMGDFDLIHTGCILSHNVRLGPFVTLFAGATVLGKVEIETGAQVGGGATLLSTIQIGANAKVGVGSVVIQNVAAGTTVMGNPARVFSVPG